MEKKVYIQPAVLGVKTVYPTQIICGSGGDEATIPGASGTKPSAIDGGIFTDSKSVDASDEDIDW